ncbi:WW domain-containing protein [Calycina marina]|uniref:WW domain-containing protein n=1 Tax=Calycina marina TaxID=1763456 RepID=A0A9P7Z5X1_9HELO|nr:WW domain-containing protein [Calycina marina]
MMVSETEKAMTTVALPESCEKSEEDVETLVATQTSEDGSPTEDGNGVPSTSVGSTSGESGDQTAPNIAASDAEKEIKSNEQSNPEDEPPLPDEAPPLPAELPPPIIEDDGWAAAWEENAQAFYFYNRFSGATQWTNPRVPDAPLPTESAPALPTNQPSARPAGGYDPAIHGDYDENAWYAQPAMVEPTLAAPVIDPAAAYTATAAFNRFTGRYQAADITPETHNDENKSKRQMNAFFDVDAAANSHDGRSLKEERSGKKLSKQELKQFKEKRKAKKEEKRRAWLRD